MEMDQSAGRQIVQDNAKTPLVPQQKALSLEDYDAAEKLYVAEPEYVKTKGLRMEATTKRLRREIRALKKLDLAGRANFNIDLTSDNYAALEVIDLSMATFVPLPTLESMSRQSEPLSLSAEYPIQILGYRPNSNEQLAVEMMRLKGRKMQLLETPAEGVDLVNIPTVTAIKDYVDTVAATRPTTIDASLSLAPNFSLAMLFSSLTNVTTESGNVTKISLSTFKWMHRIVKLLLGYLHLDYGRYLTTAARMNISTNLSVAGSFSVRPEMVRRTIDAFDLRVYYMTLSAWTNYMVNRPTLLIPPPAAQPQQPPTVLTVDTWRSRCPQDTVLFLPMNKLTNSEIKVAIICFLLDFANYRLIRRACNPDNADRRATLYTRFYMDDWAVFDLKPGAKTVTIVDISEMNSIPEGMNNLIYRINANADDMVDQFNNYFNDAAEASFNVVFPDLNASSASLALNKFRTYWKESFDQVTAHMQLTMFGTVSMPISNFTAARFTPQTQTINKINPNDGSTIQNEPTTFGFRYCSTTPLVWSDVSYQAYFGNTYNARPTPASSISYMSIDGTTKHSFDSKEAGGYSVSKMQCFATIWEPMMALLKMSPSFGFDFIAQRWEAYAACFENIAVKDYAYDLYNMRPLSAHIDASYTVLQTPAGLPFTAQRYMDLIESTLPHKPFREAIAESTTVMKFTLTVAQTDIVRQAHTYTNAGATARLFIYNSFHSHHRWINFFPDLDEKLVKVEARLGPQSIAESRTAPTRTKTGAYSGTAAFMIMLPPNNILTGNAGALSKIVTTSSLCNLPAQKVIMSGRYANQPVAVTISATYSTPPDPVAYMFPIAEWNANVADVESMTVAGSNFIDDEFSMRLYMKNVLNNGDQLTATSMRWSMAQEQDVTFAASDLMKFANTDTTEDDDILFRKRANKK
jgi:hypothetical protein